MDAADDSVRRRQWRTARHELVYFCGEYIKNAETSRARVWLLVHDINFELHPLAVDVQSFDRSAFRDAIKVVRECGSCVISARQLHMPRRFDGHRLCTFPGRLAIAFLRRGANRLSSSESRAKTRAPHHMTTGPCDASRVGHRGVDVATYRVDSFRRRF